VEQQNGADSASQAGVRHAAEFPGQRVRVPRWVVAREQRLPEQLGRGQHDVHHVALVLGLDLDAVEHVAIPAVG
jgi:hypothetical protein